MQNTILAGQSLNTIEKNIEAEISNCEYWGDLELSYDELEVLKERLQAVLSRDGVTISYICKNYPHAVTTFMVFFVRYKYDVNFWRALGDEIGIEISVNQHSEIGACAKRMFTKYKMDVTDTKDEPRQNIAPIIYEACLPPESSLDDLFYVMSYDAYKVFDPQLIIDELIDMRSYKIRKPMLRFLSRFKDDRAVDFVLEVRDAMISAEQRNARPSRYLGNYTEWKEQEKSKAVVTNRKNQEFQTRPYLFFDNGNKGLCIILPRTVMATEWIEEVAWTIKGSNGFEKTVYCRVMGDEGRRYTDTLAVSVSASEKYTIRLEDTEGLDDNSSREWEIYGASAGKILYFNSNGRQVNANYLLSPYGVMIIPKGTEIIKTISVDVSEQYYPTNTAEFRVVSITPLGNDAVLTYGSKSESYTLSARPQIRMSLEGNTLFDLKDSNIFTAIPVLCISVDGTMMTGGIEVRIGDISYPIELNDEEVSFIELSKIAASEIKQFGTYSVRLYQMGRFLKQVEFSYVPKIKTNYTSIVKWPDKSLRKDRKTFRFNMIDDWEMEFEGCTVTRDEKYYTIEVPSNVGSIPVVLKSLQESFVFKCEMDLPINPFEAEILDGEGNLVENVTDRSYKTGIDWFLENDKWLTLRVFGEFRDKSFVVQIRSANGVEQTEYIHLTQNGAGNIDLSVFNDTLRNCPLPAEIEIICDGDEEKTASIMIATEKLAMESQVRYQIGEKKSFIILDLKDDGKDIDVVRFGFHRKDIHIPYSESILGKSGKTRGYVYPGKLMEGIYVISGSMEQAVFEFEDDNSVELTQGNNVILVGKREKANAEINDIKTWLDLFVGDVLSTDANKDLVETRSYRIFNKTGQLDTLEKMAFDDRDIEKLVALAYLKNGKIVNAKKEQISRCMRIMSSKFLQRGDRYRIIELLVEMEAPQEVFDTCVSDYALLLFYSDRLNTKELAGKVENYSVELSMLLMMSTDGSIRDCVWREKYRDLIGRDAIRKLLAVPDEEDPESIAEEQKKFLRETNGSRVRINLDDEIAGNEEAIQGMIVWDTKYPMLDIKKKPEYGVYFGRIKYVDQYVNWYKNTHDKKGDMNPEKHQLMVDVIKKYAVEIEKAFRQLDKDKMLSRASKQYMKALQARCHGNSTSFSYSRFFYLQGLAAYLAKLPSYREDLDDIRIIGIRFMEVAYVVAPRLSQRDILMAETYSYLKRKEEMLCQ